jgi:hypothetical protein
MSGELLDRDLLTGGLVTQRTSAEVVERNADLELLRRLLW